MPRNLPCAPPRMPKTRMPMSKDAYGAAKDGAEQAVGIAENLMSGLGDVFKAVSAVIIDAATQAPPSTAATSASSTTSSTTAASSTP